MGFLHDATTAARVTLYSRLKRYPLIFAPIARRRENHKRRMVHRGTDLVIEGYTRSGNHPALYTFLVAQGRSMDVAHHFHAPAPLMMAVQWEVPALLLIRDPREAIPSAAMYFDMKAPRPFLRSYINFYAPLVPYADRFVVSDFPQTVGNFGAVLAEVNCKYRRAFALPTGSDEEQREVERRIRAEHNDNMGGVPTSLPLPTDEKDAIKCQIAARLFEPRFARRLAEAQRLYDYFAQRAVSPAAAGTETKSRTCEGFDTCDQDGRFRPATASNGSQRGNSGSSGPADRARVERSRRSDAAAGA